MNQFKRIFIIVIFGTTIIFSNNAIAQDANDSIIVNSEELFSTFYNEENNGNNRDFCQEITVTIDFVIGEIQTTLTVCCSTEIYICMPIIQNKVMNSENRFPNDLEIIGSATVVQGDYEITILKGKYNLNQKGEITNLKYKLTKI